MHCGLWKSDVSEEQQWGSVLHNGAWQEMLLFVVTIVRISDATKRKKLSEVVSHGFSVVTVL
jgi:hypothetical protein